MDKFEFGNYDSSQDVVFDSNKGYVEVSGETEARKQLSSPLNQLKDYINDTSSIDITRDEVIQFGITNENYVRFRRATDGAWTDIAAVNGRPGPAGPGVITGGTTGQALTKKSDYDYDTEWSDIHQLYWGDDVSTLPTPINADQLEGYSLNNLIKFMFPIGSVLQNTTNVNPSTYITGTTWTLISSVALASEHVVGNGYTLGLTQGSSDYGLVTDGNDGLEVSTGAYGTTYGGSGKTVTSVTNGPSFGVPTKTQLGANPEKSGLIADTITLYTWERTA